MDPELRARLEAELASPRMRERIDRLERVSARGPLAFAFAAGQWHDDVLAVVRIGHPVPLPRYAVVSAPNFDDEAMMAAALAALAYEMRYEDDASAVSITVYRDGRMEAVSTAHGAVPVGKEQRGVIADRTRRSAPLLARLGSGERMVVPDYGTVTVVYERSVLK